jgi:hypothetical protein
MRNKWGANSISISVYRRLRRGGTELSVITKIQFMIIIIQ